jgi:diguanylate cyclase (GGDEF)-like protein
LQLKAIKKKDFPVMLFIADADHFKNINDTYGHPFGDKVLTNISSIMNSYMRKTDCLARYGGEEFVAIMPGLSPENANEVVKRIHEAVGNAVTNSDDGSISVRVTISIGVVHLDKNIGIENAIKNADTALYEAKKTRNAVVFYDSSMSSMDSSNT